MFNNVYVHTWMALPHDIRTHLVGVFNIPRTGTSEIRDNEILSDGYSNVDLQAITLIKMNEYIGSKETSFPRAWEISCSKAKGILHPPIGMNPIVPMADEPQEDFSKELEKPTITTTSNDKTKKSK